jgi:hypothetical protein
MVYLKGLGEKAQLPCASDGFCAVSDIELAVNSSGMRFDRTWADNELASDLNIG